jgi:3-isopropylmalate/(R)-2-methylmalate dehydratase small subunit
MAKVIYKLEDDISTDIIYPGRFMATVLPTETPQFAFVDITDLNKMLVDHTAGDEPILVAGKNFGCGSSREQAASTVKGHNMIIIARNFARIFLQNSINLGVNTIICPKINAEVGDDLEITKTEVINKTKGQSFPIEPLPAARQAIIDAGGLIPYTRKLMEERNK